MSRVGNLPINLTNDIKADLNQQRINITGPNGSLQVLLPEPISVEMKENLIIVKLKHGYKMKNLHGLTRALIQNAVTGVTTGWKKNIELIGVGYRVQGGGKEITLLVGYSHPIKITAAEGIDFKILDNTHIEISGADKKMVGEIAAQIRSVKPPEPYKGKGIRYQGEYIRKKAGKAVKATTAA